MRAEGLATLEITTHPGLEDLVEGELRRAVPSAHIELQPRDLRGWVAAWGDRTELTQAALQLRTAHHLFRPMRAFTLDANAPLDQVFAEFQGLQVPELADLRVSFRVKATRKGAHDFTSEDLGRIAGSGLRAQQKNPVNLKNPDVDLRLSLIDREATVSLALTAQPLSHRFLRPFLPAYAMKPTVAWAMLQLTAPQTPPQRLLDPMCGSGTILMVAAERWPQTARFGGDREPARLQGAAENLAANRLSAELREGDARSLIATWPDCAPFDAVVCNPPFGRQIGQALNLTGFYLDFLKSVLPVLSDAGRICLLVERRNALHAALAQIPELRIRHARVVEVGGRFPLIFLIERA